MADTAGLSKGIPIILDIRGDRSLATSTVVASTTAPDNLRSLSSARSPAKGDAAERFPFDNDEWTWRDGFQTLQIG